LALINKPNELGEGILVQVCKALEDSKAAEQVQQYISEGAEIIDRDLKGWSALHYAVSRDLPLTIRVLMLAGADPFLRAEDGLRPIDLAKTQSLRELLKVGI